MNEEIRYLQEHPPLPAAPGFQGPFRCTLCGSMRLELGAARDAGPLRVTLTCAACGNWAQWELRDDDTE
jgi:transcription elongation factor Elf1